MRALDNYTFIHLYPIFIYLLVFGLVWLGLAWFGVYINICGRTSNGFYFDHTESCAFIQCHPFHRHFIQSPYFCKSIYYCFIHVPREAPAQNHAHTILICCYVCFFMFWWLFSFVRSLDWFLFLYHFIFRFNISTHSLLFSLFFILFHDPVSQI